MVKLYYDPQGLHVFSDNSGVPSSITNSKIEFENTTSNQNELISKLKMRIQELEAKLDITKPVESENVCVNTTQ